MLKVEAMFSVLFVLFQPIITTDLYEESEKSVFPVAAEACDY